MRSLRAASTLANIVNHLTIFQAGSRQPRSLAKTTSPPITITRLSRILPPQIRCRLSSLLRLRTQRQGNAQARDAKCPLPRVHASAQALRGILFRQQQRRFHRRSCKEACRDVTAQRSRDVRASAYGPRRHVWRSTSRGRVRWVFTAVHGRTWGASDDGGLATSAAYGGRYGNGSRDGGTSWYGYTRDRPITSHEPHRTSTAITALRPLGIWKPPQPVL